MRYAVIEDGVVVNVIILYPGGAKSFPDAVPCGDVPFCLTLFLHGPIQGGLSRTTYGGGEFSPPFFTRSDNRWQLRWKI